MLNTIMIVYFAAMIVIGGVLRFYTTMKEDDLKFDSLRAVKFYSELENYEFMGLGIETVLCKIVTLVLWPIGYTKYMAYYIKAYNM